VATEALEESEELALAACCALRDATLRLWPFDEGRTKDYIANPKANGYRTIHLGGTPAPERPVEVQIRTAEMHRQAEHGSSGHWEYKAGGSVKPKTRHKLSFDLGVLYFTADKRGNMYGVVASEDFGMSTAFRFLEEMLGVYDGVDVPSALDGADESLWSEAHFRNDAFGVRDLATAAWKKHSRPGDGFSYDPTADYSGSVG